VKTYGVTNSLPVQIPVKRVQVIKIATVWFTMNWAQNLYDLWTKRNKTVSLLSDEITVAEKKEYEI
jgi:hypothetical protein